MADKHMKRCSKSLIIREMQVKTAVRYHLTLVRMAFIKTFTNNKCWRVCEEKGGIKKLGIKPPYDPEIPLLGMYLEETKTERDTCIPLFIAALFTIARTWKQPRCPSTDEWIKNLWYIHTMEYYSAIKKECI